jgi:uncharacterized protein
VLLDSVDISGATEAMGMREAEFIERYTTLAQNRAQLTLKERADGACTFLDVADCCRVYAARPKQCRDFPHAWRIKGCPGLGGELAAGEKRK